jgi:hypothetical protein
LESLKNYNLNQYLNRTEHLPHKEVVKKLIDSAVLLLPLNDTPNISGVVPGKLYEYIGSGRPILAIGKLSGDSAKIMQMINSGLISDFGDVNGAVKNLETYFQQFKNGTLQVSTDDIEKFSRKNLAEKISLVLERISKN